MILGAGGFGREVADVVDALNDQEATSGMLAYELVGFLDDGEPDPLTLKPYDVGVIGRMSDLESMPEDVEYVIGVGAPHVRSAIDAKAREGGRRSPVLVHPSASMGRAVEVGAGTVICAGARLTNNISIGRHGHVNLNTTIGHDATMGDYVTLSPLVAISGYATLGDEVMIGTGATINPGVSIGAGSVIGSGAAVLKDVPANVTAVGVPAKVR